MGFLKDAITSTTLPLPPDRFAWPWLVDNTSRKLLTNRSHKHIESKLCPALKVPFASLLPKLCAVLVRVAGGREWQRCGSFRHQRGQESGVRPADGFVSVSTHHLISAQHLQSHGDVFWLMPPQGQSLHPLPGFLFLR